MKPQIALTKEQAREVSFQNLTMAVPPEEIQDLINRKILETAYCGKFGFTLQAAADDDEGKKIIADIIQYRSFYRSLGFNIEVRESFEYGEIILFSWRNI